MTEQANTDTALKLYTIKHYFSNLETPTVVQMFARKRETAQNRAIGNVPKTQLKYMYHEECDEGVIPSDKAEF